eukprot:Awhi_evm1s9659
MMGQTNNNKVNISQYLLLRLKEVNINHVFGIPGDYVLPFFDQLLDGDHGVEHIGTTNELNATYCADGYAKANGFGAAAVTFGPGSLNTTNAVAGAFCDDIPLMVIAGSSNVNVLETPTNRLYHHVIGMNFNANLQIFAPITAQSKRIMSVEEAADLIDNMIVTSMQTKKPVYLEIPYNLQIAEIHAPTKPLGFSTTRQSNGKNLNAAIQLTKKIIQESTETRTIVIGHLLQRERLEKDVVEIVNELGCSVATRFVGKNGSFESMDACVGFYMGAMSTELCRKAVENAEVTLSIGVTNNEFDTGIFTSSENKTHSIKVLLNHVIIDGQIFEDVYLRDFVPNLLLQSKDIPPAKSIANSSNYDDKFYYDRHTPLPELTNKALSIDSMMLMFAHYFLPNDVMFGDVGGYINGSQIGYPENCFLQGNGNWASLGSGFGTLVGATFSDLQNRRMIGLQGDGAFHMVAQELGTLIRHKKDVALFIFNNSGYAAERAIHPGKYRSYNDVQIWEYHKLPEVFGGRVGENCNGFEVRTELELQKVLELLKSPKGVNVVNIHLDPDDMASFNLAFSEKLKH